VPRRQRLLARLEGVAVLGALAFVLFVLVPDRGWGGLNDADQAKTEALLSSEAGRKGAKADAVYAATKAGVIAFTASIAMENARYGITVNAVAPGPIETPLLRRMPAKAIEIVTASTLLRRLGQPGEIAAAVSFLASDEASYITGETLAVSGGMGMGG
jgi:NAD(P)-dependent dehydrogenase (short-subunit alcohol dehydrogenase family)